MNTGGAEYQNSTPPPPPPPAPQPMSLPSRIMTLEHRKTRKTGGNIFSVARRYCCFVSAPLITDIGRVDGGRNRGVTWCMFTHCCWECPTSRVKSAYSISRKHSCRIFGIEVALDEMCMDIVDKNISTLTSRLKTPNIQVWRATRWFARLDFEQQLFSGRQASTCWDWWLYSARSPTHEDNKDNNNTSTPNLFNHESVTDAYARTMRQHGTKV